MIDLKDRYALDKKKKKKEALHWEKMRKAWKMENCNENNLILQKYKNYKILNNNIEDSCPKLWQLEISRPDQITNENI